MREGKETRDGSADFKQDYFTRHRMVPSPEFL